MERRFVKALDAKIKQGDFYDAAQLCRAIFDRFAKQKDFESGLTFAETYADVFAEKGQQELTISLGNRALKLLQLSNVTPTDQLIERLTTFFLLCPAGTTVSKYEYMDELIAWSEGQKDLQEQTKHLHTLIADSYLEDGKFGECQGHLVFGDDADAMVHLLDQWVKRGYPSERFLFALRLICILLSCRKVELAEKVLNGLQQDFDSENADVPAPLQAAWLLHRACKEESYELFDLITKRYALIFRLDSDTFNKLLGAIETEIFGVKRQATGLMAMLKGMMSPQVEAS